MTTLAMLSWKTNVFLAVLALAYPIAMYFMDSKKKNKNEPTQQDKTQNKTEETKGPDQ
jgi:hypothetical protein